MSDRLLNRKCLAILLVGWVAASACAQSYRTFDGSENNVAHPKWGAAGTPLGRLLPAQYANGVDSVSSSLPNVREVSNFVFSQAKEHPDARGVSEWVWLWGQFIDHDIDHTLTSSAAGTLQVPIPANDPVFGSLPQGSMLPVTRALTVPGTGVSTPSAVAREHPNNISAWLDGGMIYGGRAVDGPAGVIRSDWLRDPLDSAKLRTSDGGLLGALLPRFVLGQSPVMANTATPGMTHQVEGDLAFVAGDVRANENTSLLMLHTIFVREHNRLVDVVRAERPEWSDQEIYDRVRKVVGSEVQAITYHEFLPSLGVTLPDYTGYDPTVDPTMLTEFSNSAFRVAHSQINRQQLRLNSDGTTVAEGHLSLSQSFFNPAKLTEAGLEPLIRGLTAQVQEAYDVAMVDALRNQLFSIFLPDFGLVNTGTDLAALDILRGRDVGVGSLNQIRAQLGLNPYATFDELTTDAELATKLAQLYASPDQLDLFVGLLAEDLDSDASVGPTAMAIFEKQFIALRDGDRFWFENDLSNVNSDLLVEARWDGTKLASASQWLESLTLGDILRLNSDVPELPRNVFLASVPEPTVPAVLLLMITCVCRLSRRSRR